ncbi:MAG: hypothetical protein ACP5LM_04780, partial [Thermoplasmata archaeon]
IDATLVDNLYFNSGLYAYPDLLLEDVNHDGYLSGHMQAAGIGPDMILRPENNIKNLKYLSSLIEEPRYSGLIRNLLLELPTSFNTDANGNLLSQSLDALNIMKYFSYGGVSGMLNKITVSGNP